MYFSSCPPPRFHHALALFSRASTASFVVSRASTAEGVREGVLAPATSHVAGEWQPPVARVDVACCLAADDELAATAEGWFVVRAAPSLEVEI